MRKVIIGIIYILAIFVQYLIFMFMKKRSRVHIYVFATVLLFWFGMTTFFAYLLYHFRFFNMSKNLFAEIGQNPTEQMADKLISHIEQWGIMNQPPYWNGLRGAWFAINESSAIPTQKKLQVRNLLTANGLSLFGNEREIINNYR